MGKFDEDNFAATVNSNPLSNERDLPAAYPTKREGLKENFTAKYGRFIVGPDGSPALEAIMNDCLCGKKVLANEQWHFTKEGDIVIAIKYLIPQDQPKKKVDQPILGQRRLKKLMGDKL